MTKKKKKKKKVTKTDAAATNQPDIGKDEVKEV